MDASLQAIRASRPSVLNGLDGPSITALADQFVAQYQHAIFDGWPSAIHYQHDDHWQRLKKIDPILPGRLRQLVRYKLWLFLTVSVNTALERRAAALRAAVGSEWDES